MRGVDAKRGDRPPPQRGKGEDPRCASQLPEPDKTPTDITIPTRSTPLTYATPIENNGTVTVDQKLHKQYQDKGYFLNLTYSIVGKEK